ncbi:bifunctional 3-phenylpropionate/cinnamic acid dioxygenase ferredoxin subunit [Mycobacterium intracellulare]|uniref:bifunctional 3-phenylpropionate/cinnamic acid dioxygenase ferredoxin subunit n=1 Tax=Mycobacterium intracellulare TaxID=1767 RepID=UPI00334F0643
MSSAHDETTPTSRRALTLVLEEDCTEVVPDSSRDTYLCETADVIEGEGVRIENPSLPEAIAVFCADGKYYAVSDTCSHAEASLSEGFVSDCQVECPLHFARFDLDTGKPCSLPAIFPVKRYTLVIADGRIYVRLAGD